MSTAAIQQPFEGVNRDVDDYFGLHALSGTEIAARRGVAFKTWKRFTLPASSDYFLKVVGESHLVVLRRRMINAGGPVTLNILEGATITVETPLVMPAINLDRLSSAESLVKMYSGITTIVGGTTVDYDFRPSTGTPGQGIGAETSAIVYMRYDAHNPIIVKFHNETGQAIEVFYEFIWFEHEGPGL